MSVVSFLNTIRYNQLLNLVIENTIGVVTGPVLVLTSWAVFLYTYIVGPNVRIGYISDAGRHIFVFWTCNYHMPLSNL
jgi:hypothetical protein